MIDDDDINLERELCTINMEEADEEELNQLTILRIQKVSYFVFLYFNSSFPPLSLKYKGYQVKYR